MNGRIPDEIIQEIRDRTDIVEVVASYVSLKRSGANNQGLCPFHSEKTPSFNVNSTRQIFHCFGCGVGGNAFSFLMQIKAWPSRKRSAASVKKSELTFRMRKSHRPRSSGGRSLKNWPGSMRSQPSFTISC